ncbi:partner of Y14 and mago [Corythoichthys intestinalis]|uniref:partner of Y14 and mago n=1 Tax=Corythoichthys intestinalis TaxID=161448 RepID=UPI0025A62B6D|nr:partner of Y14 and mago [Corythoichthys intestinalis]XP_061803629.1 partner of Y14 and mago [Nerophis lumbriciformis]
MATPYVTDESGKYIAATQRPDGTWRKPRRVKEGYVPQEEVPVYENKYVKFFKNKPGLPPGLSASDAEPSNQQQQKIPGCADSDAAGLSKSAKRNLKRKEKRKQQQQQELEESTADAATLVDAVEKVSISAGGEAAEDSSSVEKAKKIKNMRKKLRQVEELQQKVDSGEIKQPTQDQLEKLARAKTLRDELEQLERLS